jgi:hypothetical protein
MGYDYSSKFIVNPYGVGFDEFLPAKIKTCLAKNQGIRSERDI